MCTYDANNHPHLFSVRECFIMRAPIYKRCEALVRGRQRLEQRVQLVAGDKHDGRLGVIDDELHGILSQRVIERHAVHALPIACLYQQQFSLLVLA